ncbi:unnamed protein product, partial [Urochloa humidicola]
ACVDEEARHRREDGVAATGPSGEPGSRRRLATPGQGQPAAKPLRRPLPPARAMRRRQDLAGASPAWAVAAAIFVFLMIVTPAIPQNEDYHDFAD